MATNNNFNDFGSSMIENRPTMVQLDAEEMTRNEWKKYLRICDEVASTAYDYMANPAEDNFPAFRTAMHALYAFVGADTRILAIDGYSVRFIPAVVPYKVVKSEQYKTAEKNIRLWKKGVEWVLEVSGVNPENPEDIIFDGYTSAADLTSRFFTAEHQDEWNQIIPLWKKYREEGNPMRVRDLDLILAAKVEVRDDLGKEKWHCYKDFKNPMESSTHKKLTHIPASIRKNIEDTMADILSARTLMTTAQLEKEHKQIKGGRKSGK